MENNVRDLLPIGSIVRLREGKKRVMVFGVKQTDKGTGTEHDYIGVTYPEGNLGQELQFYFAHKDIEEVVHKGFEDPEREDFINRLAAYYDGQR